MSVIEKVSNRELLKEYIDNATDKNVEFLYDLLNMPSYPSKRDMIGFIKKHTPKKTGLQGQEMKGDALDIFVNYDTAYPIDYFRRIEEVYPNINKGNFIFDYSDSTFGELVNINDNFFQTIYQFIKNKYDYE